MQHQELDGTRCAFAKVRESLWSVRNTIDFALRRTFRWSRRLPHGLQITSTDLLYQSEMREFLQLFHWPELNSGSHSPLSVADVGARNFALAPVLETHFTRKGIPPQVHGIEIDAFRRLRNGQTRADYGNHFASKVQNGKYYPIDFLQFKNPVDVIVLLNPFITLRPLLAWGLPKKYLNPEALFAHASHLLAARRGLLCVSSPTPSQFARVLELAEKADFMLLQQVAWRPSETSVQKQERLGALLTRVGTFTAGSLREHPKHKNPSQSIAR